MNAEYLMVEIAKQASRANPFPLYAQARELGVCRQHDGTYVVSRHQDVSALLHDPRVSSTPNVDPDVPAPPVRAFIAQDPPNHDRLRRLAMNQFGPPDHAGLVASMEPEIARLVDSLLAGLVGRTEVDIVDDFAYPLPVTVICKILGVPDEDEPRFHAWADALVRTAGAPDQPDAKELMMLRASTVDELAGYLFGLIARHRASPSDNMLSRLATQTSPDRMSDLDLAATAGLLLVAGHETTVNLIANGALTILRQPRLLERLREEPEIAVGFVEELLRMESPIQYLSARSALADIKLGSTTIPRGSRVVLLLAAASRDPDRFPNPDEFDPDRSDNRHFGFGGGIHYCFGAPLARLEGQLALTALARRLENPRLTVEPPPYRPSPVLRGPRHLPIEVAAVLR